MKITASGESSLLLLGIIKRLDRLKIPYAIVGAFAASFHGWVRASLDADAVISVEKSNEKLNQFLSLLKNDGLKIEMRRGDSCDPIGCVINVKDKFQNSVDLLMDIRGMKADIYDRITTTSFMKQKIKIIGAEDFIAMKMYAGNAKDIEDAMGVLEVCNQKINLSLLKKLTLQYGKKELKRLEEILNDITNK